MGFFSRGKDGGILNVIRCDEEQYLIWKWRPLGQDINSTTRENSIRWGSSLRVKDGEVAVFVYKQKGGIFQDFIEGPFDETIKTANFPILSSIIGLAFNKESPFQAEIYFINLAGINQIRFGIPYFDVFDPRFPDHGVPMSVRGTLSFSITDYKNFIKLHRLVQFDHEMFLKQIKSAVIKYVKGVVLSVPQQLGIPVVQMESQILNINDKASNYLKSILNDEFGVYLKSLDIDSLEIDKESEYYEELRSITAGITAQTVSAQSEVNIKNLHDMQAINATNMEESLRIQREESQRAQRLQTESNFIGAHSANLQAEVLKTGAQNLGQMSGMNVGGEGGGMNPVGMMTGMMMGGAMGQQMAGMMNNMGGQMQQNMNTPPPIPTISFYVAINGSQAGPFNMNQLSQMVQNLQLTRDSLVWKQGMSSWTPAGSVPELANLFNTSTGGMTPPPLP